MHIFQHLLQEFQWELVGQPRDTSRRLHDSTETGGSLRNGGWKVLDLDEFPLFI